MALMDWIQAVEASFGDMEHHLTEGKESLHVREVERYHLDLVWLTSTQGVVTL